MDWKSQFKVHDLSFRDTCIVLLVIAVNLFILMILFPSGPNPKAVSAALRANCGANQRQIYKHMCEVPGEEGFELPPEWTVADLIREAAGKYYQTRQPLSEKSAAEMRRHMEKEYLCRSVHYERKFPQLRRKRKEVVQQYLVFPVPASVVLDGSLQPPVPILMCPPGAHGEERGSMVLYSDGTTKPLTTEEAEKLVAEQSPVPIKEIYRNDTEENRVLEEADTALPASAQLKTEEK